jgi:hemerythrin-like domain-containing protein
MTKKIDLLTRPHQEQRNWMFSLSIKASELDFTDAKHAKEFKAEFLELIDDLKDHAENEELFILPLIATRFPKEAGIFQHDHPEQKIKLKGLVEALEEINSAPLSDKSTLALKFYRLFNQFIGEYLLHLDAEEQKILSILDQHYFAEELLGVMIAYKSFREGDEPEKVKGFIQSMTATLNEVELQRLYSSIKRNAPRPIFDKACSFSREIIDLARWVQVEKWI